MNDNNIYVTKAFMPPIEEYIEEIKGIWKDSILTNMGSKHRELENEVKKYLEVDNIALFTNGHLALETILQSMDLAGEVITTPFTFASTTHAIVRNNLTPVFCDINEDDYTIDTSKIEELITEKTCAIVAVHVYGNICKVEEIDRIAKKYNLKVIYDAAHAFGECLNGVGVGNFGDASIFSFHATKVFNTIEGGAITFSDEKIKEKVNMLKNFGIKSEVDVCEIGTNAKMNEFQACMGLCNLKYLDLEIEKREKIVHKYISLLRDNPGIRIMEYKDNLKSNYAYFPIIIDEKKSGFTRDEIYEDLKKNNIYARKYFYPLTSEFECYKGKYDSNLTPIAKYISKRVLALPLYGELSEEDVEKICNIININRK